MGAADINISFGANTAGLQQAMADVRQSVKQTYIGISSSFQNVTQTLNTTNQKFLTINQTVGSLKNSLVEKLAATSASIRNLGRITQIAASWISMPLAEFSRFEDAATRLAPLVGGLEAAKDIATHLRDEAANGTMSFEQLAGVAGKLASVFKNSDDIKKWTTIFHDLSARTGLDIKELVGNFVKLKAAGRVTGEFPEMFAQKGVNIFGELEKQTGKTAAELRKMATDGTLRLNHSKRSLKSKNPFIICL